MLDVNMLIVNNIQAMLKSMGRRQVELTEGIGVSKPVMNEIMTGARTGHAAELRKIVDYFHVSADALTKLPEKTTDTNVIYSFMCCARTEEAREAIRFADEMSDIILFYNCVYENGQKMEQPWEDD